MPDNNLSSELYPLGGMNQDDSVINFVPDQAGVSLFEQGDYRYARNVHIGTTSSNNRGALENVQSTLEVTDYKYWDGSAWQSGSPPSGNNTEIGKYEDIKNNVIYSIVYNSLGNHVILKFDGTTIYVS